ncbi:MAG TPA: hypothetical protein VJ761_08135 [Ktedonobacteraceae bacterium]|nr:hypothetical protein [Ktedonobacteraceae bacterium]
MFKPKSGVLRSLLFALIGLLLALLLAGCNLGGGSGNAPTPTPTPTPTPKPTPSPTAIPLTTYTGTGFTIGYPQGWKVTHQGNNAIQFTDPSGIYNFAVAVTSNPGGVVSPNEQINVALSAGNSNLKNPQPVSVPPTTSVGGDTWSQKSETGNATVNGQNTIVQLVVIADNHPPNSPSTRSFLIAYGTGKSIFVAANTTYFQPMLLSFKFT